MQKRRTLSWFANEYEPIKNGSIDGTDGRPHDRALIRAARARYDATLDPKIKGDPHCTLFVGRLSDKTTEETLRATFGQYGIVKRLRLVRNVVTQSSRRYAFIEYEHECGFERAYNRAHRLMLDGSQIIVDFERERLMTGWKPRRLGGGLGGKKESGQLRFGGRDRPFRVPLLFPEAVEVACDAVKSRKRTGSRTRGDRLRNNASGHSSDRKRRRTERMGGKSKRGAYL